MANKKVQEINAGSMADIAFLLLIFYLVSTTMNVDSGISRMLPPLVEDKVEDNNKMNKRNMFMVYVSKGNELAVQNQSTPINRLSEITKEFILNPTNDPTKPETEDVDIPLLGTVKVSKAVISLRSHRETSYNTYIKVQNELVRAINEAREDLAIQKFSTKYEDLTNEQREAIVKAIPSRISEAEPRGKTQ